MRNRENLVASPKTSGNSPVAKGSSVPVWPPFSEPSARFARASARVEVRPAGLSRRRTPSGPPLRLLMGLAARATRGLRRGDRLVDEARQAYAALDGLVEMEMELGNRARRQAMRQLASQESRGVLEALAGVTRRGFRAQHREEHL